MAGELFPLSQPASYSFNSDDTFKGMYGEVVSSSGGDDKNPLQDGGKRRRRIKKRTMKRKAKKSEKIQEGEKSRSNKKRGRH